MPDREGDYEVSTDARRLELEMIHDFLANRSYWARGIPRTVLEKSIHSSICFGVYQRGSRQVGFARVVTDRATFGWIMDVFVLEEHRGNGLSKLLLRHIFAHPELQGFRRWGLGTLDAHGLYAQFGFRPLSRPDLLMEIADPDVYSGGA